MRRNIILEETSVTWKYKDGLRGLSRMEKVTLMNMIQLAGYEIKKNHDGYDNNLPNTIFLKKRSNRLINVKEETGAIWKITEQLQDELDIVKEMRDNFKGVVKE